jgi:hypothetical protein
VHSVLSRQMRGNAPGQADGGWKRPPRPPGLGRALAGFLLPLKEAGAQAIDLARESFVEPWTELGQVRRNAWFRASTCAALRRAMLSRSIKK